MLATKTGQVVTMSIIFQAFLPKLTTGNQHPDSSGSSATKRVD